MREIRLLLLAPRKGACGVVWILTHQQSPGSGPWTPRRPVGKHEVSSHDNLCGSLGLHQGTNSEGTPPVPPGLFCAEAATPDLKVPEPFLDLLVARPLPFVRDEKK